jgi:hypothetical protein
MVAICVAGHQIAFHHFGKIGDHRFEQGQMAIVLLVEPDANERGNGQPREIP